MAGADGTAHSVMARTQDGVHWPRYIARLRRAGGLTQSGLAEALAVDQATISRWERGLQTPDIGVQKRLRDLYRSSQIVDRQLRHMVETAPVYSSLTTEDRVWLAVWPLIAAGHKSTPKALRGFSIARHITPEVDAIINEAREAGFFRGDVASVRSVFPLYAFDGRVRYFSSTWTPQRLSDGTIVKLDVSAEVDEATYEALKVQGVRITMMDELLDAAAVS